MIFPHFTKNNKTPTPFIRKIFLLVSGLFLCVILLEVGLRVGGLMFLSFQEHKNIISARQKGAYRILCLGESTTANTWPFVLEKILNQSNIGIKFSVIDKGRTGANSQAILRQVGSYLDEYHPDMVVAMMGCNDNGIMYYQDIPKSNTWLFRHCRLYRFGRIIYGHILKKLKKDDRYGLNKLKSDGKGKLENTLIIAKEKNTAVLEKSNNYAPANNSTYSFTIKDIDLKTGDADIYAGFGKTNKGFNKKIEESYLMAIKMYPKNQNLYLGLAIFYETRQMFDQAEKTHLKGIKVNPENYGGYFALGLMYEHFGNNVQAEKIYKKIIEINARTNAQGMRAYYNLGSLYSLQGQYDKAEEVLIKGIALDPDDDMSYSNLALIYEKQKKYGLAKEYFAKAGSLRSRGDNLKTRYSYQKLNEILRPRGIKLVLVQYPLRSMKYLKKMLDDQDGIVFVDNELTFKKAVENSSYEEYFTDRFAGDFGHCTPSGYELLARNIADTILKDVFRKP